MAGNRPLGVAILAVLVILGGILVLLGAAVSGIFLGALGVAGSTGALGSIISTVASVLSILFVIIGILFLITGYGLWTGAKWGWWIYIVWLVFGLIISLLGLISGSITSIVSIIIDVVIIYYMTKKSTKAYFGM